MHVWQGRTGTAGGRCGSGEDGARGGGDKHTCGGGAGERSWAGKHALLTFVGGGRKWVPGYSGP
ncbi:hypothetical protein Pflav_072250 [Phytohabitans flavus]|uniref:Uncharacterized protein n=1 Tax=Phytohabitans flavus TaxID=1076124 RepID=A0A6F8Y3Y9_9ACTN|nr:hypothetical protein Pflav_072250 [Phytohabitans flavus]